MQTFHVVHHEPGKAAQLFEVGHKRPLRFNIVRQSLLDPRSSLKTRYRMRVSDPKFFAELVENVETNGAAPLTLSYDNGITTDYTVKAVNGRLFLENRSYDLAVLTGPNGSTDSSGSGEAMALDPVTTVAIAAIIAITIIAVTDNGGSFSGSASSEGKSVTVEADGGNQEGNNNGGDGEQ